MVAKENKNKRSIKLVVYLSKVIQKKLMVIHRRMDMGYLDKLLLLSLEDGVNVLSFFEIHCDISIKCDSQDISISRFKG